MIDLIAHIVFVGFKRLIKKKKEYLCELILQIAATIIILLYTTVDKEKQVRITRLLSITMLIRNLRLTALLWELPDFRKIVATFERFSRPFFTIMFSLYTVMFFFAIIGEFFFAGVITVESVREADTGAMKLYYLINFNDMYASMITLFHVLVVNNWN